MVYQTNLEQNLKSKGFFIVKGFVEDSKIESCLEQISQLIRNSLDAYNINYNNTDSMHSLAKILFEYDTKVYLKVISSIQRLYCINDLLENQNVIKLLQNSFGFENVMIPGGGVFHIMSKALQIPNGYFGLGAHQDFPSVQGSLDGLVAWMPLTSVDVDNFPLQVVPGSHKNWLYEVELEDDASRTPSIKQHYFSDDDFIDLEMDAGDVVFFSYFLVHKSSLNGDERCRMAVSTRFDNSGNKSFISRNYPTAYKRHVLRDMMSDCKNDYFDFFTNCNKR